MKENYQISGCEFHIRAVVADRTKVIAKSFYDDSTSKFHFIRFLLLQYF